MTNFANLKTWLKHNNVEFTKGYSDYDGKATHDFVIILSADLKVYNDKSCLILENKKTNFHHLKATKSYTKKTKEKSRTTECFENNARVTALA